MPSWVTWAGHKLGKHTTQLEEAQLSDLSPVFALPVLELLYSRKINIHFV